MTNEARTKSIRGARLQIQSAFIKTWKVLKIMNDSRFSLNGAATPQAAWLDEENFTIVILCPGRCFLPALAC